MFNNVKTILDGQQKLKTKPKENNNSKLQLAIKKSIRYNLKKF